MQRITGRYNPYRSLEQLASSKPPQNWRYTSSGERLPVGCGSSGAVSTGRGVTLYVSATGEVPLYYSIDAAGNLHWHEQSLALPGKPEAVEKGQVVAWDCKTRSISSSILEELPRPDIRKLSKAEAIAGYQDKLLSACRQRVGSETKVAVAQSAGLDSFLVTWALRKLGVEVVPITIGTAVNCWDVRHAADSLKAMNIEHYPIILSQRHLLPLLKEAVLCFERFQADNLLMGAMNLAIAKKCQQMGISTAFIGHGHDDLHGSEGLVQGDFKALTTGTRSERWRDARRASFKGIGMEKMFATTFRRYGVEVKAPFFDFDLMDWVLSWGEEIIPIQAGKPFARELAIATLEVPGTWSADKYKRKGYITGAGIYENYSSLNLALDEIKTFLQDLKQKPWQQRAAFHL